MIKPDDKVCQNCGRLFTPSKNDKRIVFCSSDCQIGYRKKTGYMEHYYRANLKRFQDRNNSRKHMDAKNKARRQKYAEDEAFREKHKQQVKDYNARNPSVKVRQRLRKYGLTKEQYDEMLTAQNGRCKICGCKGDGSQWNKLYVDHDHQTGKVRGLLCGHCNFAIGQFQDDTERMEKAIKYLRGEL